MRFVLLGCLYYLYTTVSTYVLTEFLGIYYFLSYAVVYSVGVALSFVFAFRWIFNVSGRLTDRLRRYLTYLLGFYVANIALVRFSTEFLGVHYIVSITAVTVGLFVAKYFVYRDRVFNETLP